MNSSNWPQNTTNSTFWWDQREVRKACLWTTPQQPGEPELLPIIPHTPWPRMESLQGVGSGEEALTREGPGGPCPPLPGPDSPPADARWVLRMRDAPAPAKIPPQTESDQMKNAGGGWGEAETRGRGSRYLRLPLLSHAFSLLDLPTFLCLIPHPGTTEHQVSGACLPWAPLRWLFQVFAQD